MSEELEYIDIKNVILSLWRGKYIVMSITLIFTLSTLIWALFLPDMYTSRSVLKPVQQRSAVSAGLESLSTLRSLTGVGISAEVSEKDTVLAILKSRKFLVEFAESYELVPELMAAKIWDKKTNRLEYDLDIYDPAEKKWVRNVSAPLTPRPNDTEIYERFREIITIDQEHDSGLITFEVTSVSPALAYRWNKLLIENLNVRMRDKAIRQLDRRIEYLQAQMQSNTVTSVGNEMAGLLQVQLREKMLANATEEFSLETIDPPFQPEFKSRPSRSLLVALGFFAGGVFGVLTLLIIHALTPAFLVRLRLKSLMTVDSSNLS